MIIMVRTMFWFLLQLILVLLLMSINGNYHQVNGSNVTYDGRSLIINGQHKILFSGSIHYPRSTPKMWPSLIAKAKEGGMDVIETYVFWNLHEPKPGQYNFRKENDIVRFIKEIHAHGLYACLRIGPYINSEWTYGGFPFWLHDVPGIVFRTDNEPFKYHMKKFVTKIVDMMKAEKLFASQGGPIILSQIENEYGIQEEAYGEKGPIYVKWAASMAVGLQTGVPWVMCKQNDAPDPVINTCNGKRCGETFTGPNKPYKPSIWTENWTSFVEVYGGEPYLRAAEDIAYHVALFIARNGSFVNYYMYHGGTNFGRTAAAFIKASYYDQAPLDEYGLIREPKWSHLKELHGAIKSCSNTLLYGSFSTIPLGPQHQAYVFTRERGECAAFLVNNGSDATTLVFRNISYELPTKSISILPDCKSEIFNTAKVKAKNSSRSMVVNQKLNSSSQWEEYKESIPNFDDTKIRASTLLDHMSTTKDFSDYLWYTFRLERNESDDHESLLNVYSKGHVLHVFVNGVYTGFAHGSKENPTLSYVNKIHTLKGTNSIALLSATVGLLGSGAYMESKVLGLRSVKIDNQDFTNFTWGYKVGTEGERLRIHKCKGVNRVPWTKLGAYFTPQPLTWYKAYFDAPGGSDPVALNLGTMGKGLVWVNGHNIARYWLSFLTPSGVPSQTWYHVPRSIMRPKGNLLILFEEATGNPLGITVDTVSVTY